MNYEIRSGTDWYRSISGIDTPPVRETMFIATTSFTADDHYCRRIEITAGLTRLAPSDELVARFPDRFREIDSAGGPGVRNLTQDARTRTAVPVQLVERSSTPPLDGWGSSVVTAAPSADLGEIPRFVEPSTRKRVTLTNRARQQLTEAARQAVDGLEWGGWLYGMRVRGWQPIVIERVVGAGPNAKRSTHSMTLPVDEWRESWEGGALELIGMWHTHSNDLGPSEADRVMWRDDLLDIETAHYGAYHLGLIAEVGEARGDWWKPRLNAFVTRRDHVFSRVVCERADVDEL